MHGTGAFTSFSVLSAGGCVVLLPSRHFDPAELLDEVEAKGVNAIAIVGDAFAKPILGAPHANEGHRKSDVEGKSVSVRVDLGGRRIINQKKNSESREVASK